MYLLVAFEFLVHITEELWGNFPTWASKYFGTTTLNWYLISHLLVTPLVVFICLKAQKLKKDPWVFGVITIQTVIFTNGLFHLITTFLFKEYSPGLISSVLITFPFSIWFFRRIFQRKSFIKPILLGSLISILVILSLYLEI